MSGLVSIIIPVYNLEKYIQFNIDNMLSQSYENLEIIYVDDGSTDSSAQIIKSAAEKDSRIKYYYKENGGVSSARNFGIEKANGEYIMFVDGDDIINKHAVELYYGSIIKANADISFSNMTEINDIHYAAECPANVNDVIIGLSDILKKEYIIVGFSSCAKLFKASFISDLRFNTSFKIGEDTLFMSQVLNKNPAITYIDTPLYYYYQRQESAMHSGFDNNKFVVGTMEFIVESLEHDCNDYIFAYYLMRLYHFICYERTLVYGRKEFAENLEHYQKIGKKYFSRLFGCKPLGKKRFIYAAFFLSRPLYEKYRLMKDPTMKDFYNQRKQNNNQ